MSKCSKIYVWNSCVWLLVGGVIIIYLFFDNFLVRSFYTITFGLLQFRSIFVAGLQVSCYMLHVRRKYVYFSYFSFYTPSLPASLPPHHHVCSLWSDFNFFSILKDKIEFLNQFSWWCSWLTCQLIQTIWESCEIPPSASAPTCNQVPRTVYAVPSGFWHLTGIPPWSTALDMFSSVAACRACSSAVLCD